MFSVIEEHYNKVTYKNDTHELSNKIYALMDLALTHSFTWTWQVIWHLFLQNALVETV
jgi:hypothetical protein